MTARPCAVVICCAYAAPNSEFCPAHVSLHAQGLLNLDTGQLDTRRRSTTRRQRSGQAELPLEPNQTQQTEIIGAASVWRNGR